MGRSAIEAELQKILGGTTANLNAEKVRIDGLADDLVIVTFVFANKQVSSRHTNVARYDGSRWKIVQLHASHVREPR